MFEYYGGKGNLVRWGYYPEPQHDTIIEPFAGAARYSLRYGRDRKVILIDKSPVIMEIWRWLQTVTETELAMLPMLQPGERIPDIEPQGAKWFMGFVFNQGSESPRSHAGKYIERLHQVGWKRYFANLAKIRDWTLIEGDYQDAPDIKATWFIDPPYCGQRRYPHGRDICYEHLAGWCQARRGQVIVCENSDAKWLPFQHLTIANATQRKASKLRHEGIWLKEDS